MTIETPTGTPQPEDEGGAAVLAAQDEPGATLGDPAADHTPPGVSDAQDEDQDGDGDVPSYEELEVDRDHWRALAGADKGKLAAEAAGYRTQLRETEAERDAQTERLAARDLALFDAAARVAGVNPQQVPYLKSIVDVEGHTNADGLVDIDSLAGAIDHARAEAGLPRRPRPDPVAARNRDQLQRTARDELRGAFGVRD